MQQGTDSASRDLGTLLYVDECVPVFDRDARSATTRHYLELLSGLGFGVTFWPRDRQAPEPYTSALRGKGIEVHAGKGRLRDYLAVIGGRASLVCLAGPTVAAENAEMTRTLTDARILYVSRGLGFVRHQRMIEIAGGLVPRWRARRMERIEWKAMRECDVTVVFSAIEKELLAELEPSLHVEVWPWIQEAADPGPDFGERSGLLFLGGFDRPENEDAVLWFTAEVLPPIRRRLPNVRFVVIGPDPTAKVTALRSSKVTVTGSVPNVAKYLHAARVSVAPLRASSGVRGEVLTAMAHGLPVVATSVVAEGTGIENESETLIADAPEDFAEAILTLHGQYASWKRLSRTSVEFVARNASRERARTFLEARFGNEGSG